MHYFSVKQVVKRNVLYTGSLFYMATIVCSTNHHFAMWVMVF